MKQPERVSNGLATAVVPGQIDVSRSVRMSGMRVEPVEIYSDTANAAVMRHPGRHFPGFLIQGDSLYALCRRADDVCASIGRGAPGFDTANELRNTLWASLTHYKTVMIEHQLPLPFDEAPLT
jgi:hypothetical protein